MKYYMSLSTYYMQQLVRSAAAAPAIAVFTTLNVSWRLALHRHRPDPSDLKSHQTWSYLLRCVCVRACVHASAM